MTRILPLAMLLAVGAPTIAPVQAEAARAAEIASVLPDDCPEYTPVGNDLADMGVDISLFPYLGQGDVQLLTMVEWGFTGAAEAPAGFNVYIYLYDPEARSWGSTGSISMAFADEGDGFYDNSFRSFAMTLVDREGIFSKWKVSDPASLYPLLGKARRRYLLGSVSLRDSSGDLSFQIGKEYDFSGFPKSGNNDVSTLTVTKQGFQCVRAEVFPFTSDAGGISGSDTRVGWQFSNYAPFRSDLSLFSVAFSLPSWVDGFGDLYSVHYDYYKYRTNWIYSFKDDGDWDDVSEWVGTESLLTDGEYSQDKPGIGWMWLSLFDMDDITGITTDSDGLVDGHQPYARFFNNGVDSGHHELRVDTPKWAFKLTDEEWEEGRRFTSDELLSYAEDYAMDGKASDDLPVLNGTVSNELFYVPSYSEDSLFREYGNVDRSIGRDDILSTAVSDLLDDRLERPFLSSSGITVPDEGHLVVGEIFRTLIFGPWSGSIRYDGSDSIDGFSAMTDIFDRYLALWENGNPDTFGSLMEDSVPLLADWSDDDPVVRLADDEYVDGLSSFVSSQGTDNVYRLTYDASMTNTYGCWSGSSSLLDGTWTAQTIQASKTDAVFDFRFIDFTFSDGSETYILPASSDPFDIAGPIETNPNPDEGLPRWAVILIVCVIVFFAIGILSFFFPVFKLLLRGALLAVEAIIDFVYILLVWWWLAIVRRIRGEALPPLWLFGGK